MARRRDADIESAETAATVRSDATRTDDPILSRYVEWMRQVERIEAASVAGLAHLLQSIGSRAASARSWAEWVEAASACMNETVDEAARTQGEWLSALVQGQMEACKMLLDFGGAPPPGDEVSAKTYMPAGFAPWLALAALRPVQIS